MQKVSIVRCESYDQKQTQNAVFECLSRLECIRDKIKPGSKVLVKANLLMRKNPNDAVTTHPMVIEAIARYLQELGCKVIIGDSPGGPFTDWNLKSVYRAAGMFEVAERTDCELNFNTEVLEISNPNAKRLKAMQIIKIAWAACNESIPVVVAELAALIGGPVECALYKPMGSLELAETAALRLKDRNAILLANHGVLAVGYDIDTAYGNSVVVEEGAKIAYYARQIGVMRLIPEDECESLRKTTLNKYGQK